MSVDVDALIVDEVSRAGARGVRLAAVVILVNGRALADVHGRSDAWRFAGERGVTGPQIAERVEVLVSSGVLACRWCPGREADVFHLPT